MKPPRLSRVAWFFIALCSLPSGTQAQAECGINVVSVAVNPQNPAILYAGSSSSGLFRSADAGQTWTPLAEPRISSVSSIAIDRQNTARIFLSTYQEFIHRTTDGGATWVDLWRGIGGSLFNTSAIFSIVIDPSRPDLLFADAGTLYRSENGGQTWDPIDLNRSNPLRWTSITDAAPLVLFRTEIDYVGNRYHLRRSADRGVTWQQITDTEIPFTEIQSDPHDPMQLYGGSSYGIYRSADGGTTWAKIYPLPSERLPVIPPSPYFLVRGFAVDPQLPDHVYAPGDTKGVLKSLDTGRSWTVSRSGLENSIVNSVVVDPSNSSILYAATSNGVFRSTDAGSTWQASFALGTSLRIVGVDPPELFVWQTSESHSDGSTAYGVAIKGTGFVPGSQVVWNGNRRTTSFSSCISLYARIQSSDFATPGTASIQVINPDGAVSEGFLFAIHAGPPARLPARSTPHSTRYRPPR